MPFMKQSIVVWSAGKENRKKRIFHGQADCKGVDFEAKKKHFLDDRNHLGCDPLPTHAWDFSPKKMFLEVGAFHEGFTK